MWISKLTISNFRSFGNTPVEIHLESDLTGFIGLNSTGKTASLESLRKLFGATQQERELTKQDFHVPGDKSPDDVKEIPLFIEARLDFEEGDDDAIPEFFNQMVISVPETNPYIRVRLEANWMYSAQTADGDIEQTLSFIQVPEGAVIDDDARQRMLPHHRNKIRCFYIPAIRRPGEQIKYVSGTVLHQLLRRIEIDAVFRESFKTNITAINKGFQEQKGFGKVQTSMTTYWEDFHKDKRYRETKITFGGDDVESILRKIDIEFSPTGLNKSYKVDDLGEGLRSLFYLTLVCTLLEVEQNNPMISQDEKPLLTILAIEEPENHISPQLIGRVIGNLMRLSKRTKPTQNEHENENTPSLSPNTQVLFSSHTPAIIKRIRPEAIRHFRLNAEKHRTLVSKILLPDNSADSYKYIKEAIQNYPEIYFSRLVVIGEGDSEEVVFNRLASAYNRDFDDNMISFVPLGHRFVNHIWRLLHQLDIPYVTLLDLDLEREGGGWGRVKYALKQLLDIGVERKRILEVTGGGVLSDVELDKMHTWDETQMERMQGWVDSISNHNVFFSSPLDLDFMLLSAFKVQYLAQKNRGPQIPDKATNLAKFQEKVESAVYNTLKSKKATGALYSEADRELMIWYDYLFLGKGKPITHLEALRDISDDDLKAGLPEVLKTLFLRIETLIKQL
jgi:putative ATP-dependent endonuclease of the OLD family